MPGALDPQHKPPQRVPSGLGELEPRQTLFQQAQVLNALKGDPIYLACVKLAFRKVLQRELFGRAEGRIFYAGDLSGAGPARTAAAWRSGGSEHRHLAAASNPEAALKGSPQER
jgi:hypothetical protein